MIPFSALSRYILYSNFEISILFPYAVSPAPLTKDFDLPAILSHSLPFYPIMKNSQSNSTAPAPDKNKPTLAHATVETGDALPPDAEFDEKFMDFWKKNGVLIFGAIAAIGLGVVCYQAFGLFQEYRKQSVATEFSADQSTSGLNAFIAKHPQHPLTGLALLRLGHEDFANEKFADAADKYQRAATLIEDSALVQRATVGQGVALIRAGQVDAGIAVLKALTENPAGFQSARAEAAYNVAIVYWERQNFAEMDKAIKQIEALDQSGIWMFRASQLRNRVPELGRIEG